MEPEQDPIQEAREAVDAVRGLLLAGTPQALAAGIPHLECAVGCMETIQKAVAAGSIGGRQASDSVAGLRQSISGIVRLMDSSAAFYHDWWTLPETGVADYTPGGERPTSGPPRTLSIQG